MVSIFELLLIHSVERKDKILSTLLEWLACASMLTSLRAASRTLRCLVDSKPGYLYRKLYMRAPLLDVYDLRNLELIAPLCRDLTIKIGYPAPRLSRPRAPGLISKLDEWFPRANMVRNSTLWRRRRAGADTNNLQLPPTIVPSIKKLSQGSAKKHPSIPPTQLSWIQSRQQPESRRIWTQLLSHFRQLYSLTLRINGDPGWPGRTGIEDMLVTLRMAIESARLQDLRNFSLSPVHAMGIVHLRWHGFGIFHSALASGAAVWMQLEMLELRIHNPFAISNTKLTENQRLMFWKILYEYLRSFAPSIRVLRLIWLGGDGPNPLAIHQQPGLEDRPPIKWPRLEQLWVGNTTLPHRATMLVQQHARANTRVMNLKSIHRDSSMDPDDSDAWVHMLPLGMTDAHDTRSSVYSGSGRSGSVWAPGISRSSQDLTVILSI